MHTQTSDVKMTSSPVGLAKSNRGRVKDMIRSVGRVTVVFSMIFSLEFAMAQNAAADCNAVSDAAMAARTSEVAGISERERLTAQAVENAKSCIDRLMQVIRNMSVTLPSLQSISIQAIVDYLSNRACAVAMSEVQQQVGGINGAVNGAVNNTVGGVTGGINDGVNGATGGLTNGMPVVTPGPGTTVRPQSTSVFGRLGCFFGAGSNCPSN